MILRFALLALPLLLAACNDAPAPTPAPSSAASLAAKPAAPAAPPQTSPAQRPDPARCPALTRDDENGLLERKAPLPVPPALAGVVAADMNQFAVTTLGGAQGCIDVRWMEQTGPLALSTDERFLTFAWQGYEAFGFVVFDRSGKGQEVDTGTQPAWSPSRARFAAVDLGEAAFGALNGFGVWDVQPAGIKELSIQADGLPMGEWRITGWRGEQCVALTRQGYEGPRENWFASAAQGWKLQAGSCPKA